MTRGTRTIDAGDAATLSGAGSLDGTSPSPVGGGSRWPRLDRLRAKNRDAPLIYREHRYLTWAVLLVVVALIVPRVFSSTPHQYLVDVWLVYAIAGIGFYWVFGLAGRFAFCQTFMMALGGYFSDWVTQRLGADWYVVSMVAAMVVAAVAALLIGLLLMRAAMFYFAIGTLAVAQVGNVVFTHTTSFSGPNGTVVGVPAPNVFGRELTNYNDMFWLLFALMAAIVLLGIMIERSTARRDAIAARDNAEVARTVGVPVARIQLVMFILGSALGGLSGSLLGSVSGTTSTSSFGTELAIGIFLMLLIGGIDSVWGPIVGAAFYVAIPQWLSSLQEYQAIVYGGLLLAVIIAFPQGIVGGVRSVADRIRGRTGSRASRPPVIRRTEPAPAAADGGPRGT